MYSKGNKRPIPTLILLLSAMSAAAQNISLPIDSITSVEIYAALQNPEPGVLGFDFVEAVATSIKNGSEYFEMHYITVT